MIQIIKYTKQQHTMCGRDTNIQFHCLYCTWLLQFSFFCNTTTWVPWLDLGQDSVELALVCLSERISSSPIPGEFSTEA